MSIIKLVCRDHIYLAIPREGLKKKKAQTLLRREAKELGLVPDVFNDACLLGNQGPTLYCLRAKAA